MLGCNTAQTSASIAAAPMNTIVRGRIHQCEERPRTEIQSRSIRRCLFQGNSARSYRSAMCCNIKATRAAGLPFIPSPLKVAIRRGGSQSVALRQQCLRKNG